MFVYAFVCVCVCLCVCVCVHISIYIYYPEWFANEVFNGAPRFDRLARRNGVGGLYT